LWTGRTGETIRWFNQHALWLTRAGTNWVWAAIRIGLLMPVVSIAALLPVVLLRAIDLGPSVDSPADPNTVEVFGAVVVSPVLETLFVVLIYRLTRARLGLTGFVLITTVLAAAAHAPFRTLPPIGAAIAFALMSYQYASFREQLGFSRAYWGVSLAHATNNGVGVVLMLSAGFLE
jgi:hypothetical protein